MTIQNSLRAALADMHLVTDEQESAAIRGPLKEFRTACPYADFITRSTDAAFPFEAPAAHIVTRASMEHEPKDAPLKTQTRRIQRNPGRALDVPAIKLKASSDIPFAPQDFVTDEIIDDLARSIPSEHGRMFAGLVEANLLWVLMESAKHDNRFMKTDISHVKEVTAKVVNSMGCECSVLASYRDGTKVLDSPRMSYRIGDYGTVNLRTALGSGALIVVANDPKKVGFVRERTEPITGTLIDEFDIEVLTVGEYGFCAWADAPLTVVDFSPG